ncbi:MAG TPA: ADP-ribosylglycohydrolase family protein, partial [Acidimicrobiia bacterium]|nr:ADP-ribosylglycohydrolase family protein [Acidimicrobiia bacterium]
IEAVFDLAVTAAGYTHGHPTGKLASGALAAAVGSLVQGAGLDEALDLTAAVLAGRPGHEETSAALAEARRLAAAGPPSADAVVALGEGWVAEEALAIAVYCALTGGTFEVAVRAAVNHSGDSDSTGAITGNLLGAAGGRGVVPEPWLAALAERALVERVVDDLVGCFGPSGS